MLVYACCSLLLVVVVTAPNFAAQINIIPMLTGMNFKSWKESAEIVLGCNGLGFVLEEECPVSTPKNRMKKNRKNGTDQTVCAL